MPFVAGAIMAVRPYGVKSARRDMGALVWPFHVEEGQAEKEELVCVG